MEDMTKRDLFAMAALQGLLAGPTMIKGGAGMLADYSYEIADAMMAKSGEASKVEIAKARLEVKDAEKLP